MGPEGPPVAFNEYLVVYPLVNIQKTMESHHFSWENSLFLWPFSIAMLNYQRVDSNLETYKHEEKWRFVA